MDTRKWFCIHTEKFTKTFFSCDLSNTAYLAQGIPPGLYGGRPAAAQRGRRAIYQESLGSWSWKTPSSSSGLGWQTPGSVLSTAVYPTYTRCIPKAIKKKQDQYTIMHCSGGTHWKVYIQEFVLVQPQKNLHISVYERHSEGHQNSLFRVIKFAANQHLPQTSRSVALHVCTLEWK